MGHGRRRRRRRVEPTDDWEHLELLCAWDEQREYERIRPLVLFGEPIPERALQNRTSERTLYRKISFSSRRKAWRSSSAHLQQRGVSFPIRSAVSS